MSARSPRDSKPPRRRDLAVAAACGVFVATMVGAAYAAVPFYNWFCRATGFQGTTQVATSAPAAVLDRKVRIRFDANVAGNLPWRFEPDQTSIEARIGEVVTVGYTVVNESARATVGEASYNVTPPTVGAYFSKINCFCFTEQTARAGRETRHDGRVLRRSRPGQGRRAGRPRQHHLVLHDVCGAPAGAAARGGEARTCSRTELIP